ncbi:MAG: biotin transporter BioY [Treponema sp.]|nr:biotin transporter BioY [Treponema sp.]MDD7534723.1 biotin transporter BioY [Treponema sp.]MDY5758660.1 biotin transporter BioY [Treponema sp.]
MKNKSVLKISFIALFAAIICVGCFIRIPLGVIPIVLQNILCILCGVLLGGFLAGAPTALFLLAGLIGLPVYSGGTSGLAVWMGPTGGFLPGYLLGAIVAGFIAGKPSVEQKKITWKNALRVSLAVLAGMVILYIPGVIRFSFWATAAGKVPAEKTAFAYTMAACVIPYIPGDLLKTVVAIPVALKLRPILAQYLYENTDKD